MTGSALHGVGVHPPSFRTLVAESSHCEIKPFCCHFLDAATARSMTGGAFVIFWMLRLTRSMAGGAFVIFWMLRLRAA